MTIFGDLRIARFLCARCGGFSGSGVGTFGDINSMRIGRISLQMYSGPVGILRCEADRVFVIEGNPALFLPRNRDQSSLANDESLAARISGAKKSLALFGVSRKMFLRTLTAPLSSRIAALGSHPGLRALRSSPARSLSSFCLGPAVQGLRQSLICFWSSVNESAFAGRCQCLTRPLQCRPTTTADPHRACAGPGHTREPKDRMRIRVLTRINGCAHMTT